MDPVLFPVCLFGMLQEFACCGGATLTVALYRSCFLPDLGFMTSSLQLLSAAAAETIRDFSDMRTVMLVTPSTSFLFYFQNPKKIQP